MNLDDIFYQLANGELSQLVVGSSGDGTIPKEKRKALTASIKLGLDDLYRNFLLNEKSFLLILSEGVTTYPLTELTDLLKVERIEDSEGVEVPLNDLNNATAVNMTQYNVLEVPANPHTETYTVFYRAEHPALDMIKAEAAPFLVDIELPPQFLQALLFFVGSRVHAPLAGGEVNLGTEYLMKYEAEKLRLKELSMGLERVTDTTRFKANGWV